MKLTYDVYNKVMTFMETFEIRNREDVYQKDIESLNLVADCFELVKNEIIYDHYEDNVIDTECSKCGYGYGMTEGDEHSTCPRCEHVDHYYDYNNQD